MKNLLSSLAFIGALAVAGCDQYAHTGMSGAEQVRLQRNHQRGEYLGLPTTNVVAKRGDTASGLVMKYAPEYPLGIQMEVFNDANSTQNGMISAGKSYEVRVSPRKK